MQKQYIKVFRHMNTLHEIYRTIDGEKHYQKHTEFPCEFFIPTDKESQFLNLIDDSPLVSVKCNGFKEYKDNVEKYRNLMPLFGLHKPEDQFRRNNYYGKETFLSPKICYFDIETGFNGSTLDDSNEIISGIGGFPKPTEANAPITCFSMSMDNKKMVLGLKDLDSDIPGWRYEKCSNEIDLIDTFFKVIKLWSPDILVGWNTDGFDFPFIVNRIKKLEMDIKCIDNLGIIEDNRYLGVEVPKSYYWMDLMHLYKNFIYTPRESYSLQAIGMAELGTGKVEYHEDGNLEDLYRNNFQKFTEYAAQDVQLLIDIDSKLNLMSLICELSYLYNINFSEVVGTTGPWGQLLYCEAYKQHKIIPEPKHANNDDYLEGGWVHCNPGFYEWVVSFDFASLYPSLIQAFNYCPSTYINESELNDELKQIRSKYVKSDNEEGITNQILLTKEQKEEMHNVLSKYNVSLSPSGHFFDITKDGLLPFMMKKIYTDRKIAKKKMQEFERSLYSGSNLSDDEKDKIKASISRYNNQQMALKISINSAYGALGNSHFILAKRQIAESITSGGRFYDRMVKYEVDKVLTSKFNYNREPVQAGDTDSVYVHLSPVVEKSKLTDTDEIITYLQTKIIPVIDNIIETKVLKEIAHSRNLKHPEVMVMEREVIANKGIFVGRKNYVLNVLDNEGTRYPKGKKKIVGLTIKKTNLPEFIRTKMLCFLDILFDKTENSFQQEFGSFKKEFWSLDLENICFPKGVNLITDKERSGVVSLGGGNFLYTLETTGVPINVRAALLYNKYISEKNLLSKYSLITNGNKIKFIYLSEPNPICANVIGFPNDKQHQNFLVETGLSEYVDYNKMFEGLVIKPLEPLIQAIGWDFTKKIKLTDFF